MSKRLQGNARFSPVLTAFSLERTLLLATGEVAHFLGLYRTTVARMCQKGMLRFVLTPGGQRGIIKDSLEGFLKGKEDSTTSSISLAESNSFPCHFRSAIYLNLLMVFPLIRRTWPKKPGGRTHSG